MKVKVYSTKLEKVSEVDLPREFSGKPNLVLLSQAIRVYEGRQHLHTAKVKTRGDVAISTRKIYRQKGTGFARHGAKSAPIFVGGGIAHGPKGVKKVLVLPKKMRNEALHSAFLSKALGGNLALVEGLEDLTKTKKAGGFLKKIVKENQKITLVLKKEDQKIKKVFSNIKNIKVLFFPDCNAFNVFSGGLILVDRQLFLGKEKSEKPKKVVVKDKKLVN